jgi:oligopeptide transport system substrate-binding protein
VPSISTPELYAANKSNKDKVKAPEAVTVYIEYNQTGKNKFLANTKIRQALNLATNRKELGRASNFWLINCSNWFSTSRIS